MASRARPAHALEEDSISRTDSLKRNNSHGSNAESVQSQAPSFATTGSRAGSIPRRPLSLLKARPPSFKRTNSIPAVTVPQAVRERLTYLRNQRRENSRSLTLSQLLSVSAVRHEFHATGTDGPAADGSAATVEPASPSRFGLLQPGAMNPFAGAVDGTVRDPLDEGASNAKAPVTYITPEVNKKIRTQLLRQHWFTNRFEGSREAARCEEEFIQFIGVHQLRRVRFRLLVTAAAMLFAGVENMVDPHRRSFSYLFLKTILPMLTLLIASMLCFLRRTRPWWRSWVVIACFVVYNLMLWSDVTVDVSGWSEESQDYSTIMQCVWCIVIMQYSALGFSLDFVNQLILVPAQYFSFVIGTLYLSERYRSTRAAALLAAGINPDAPPLNDGSSNCTDSTDVAAVWHQCNSFTWSTGNPRPGIGGVWTILEALLFGGLAALLLLLAVRRHNRFERQSFVNSFVLLNKAITEEKKKRGEGRDLLALFSNPSAPQQLHLRPLQLGQELKFLLRSVPSSSVQVEPAASLNDVEGAIKRCDPLLLFFSGHSFAGSLAFELPNGRIELPPPDQFIDKLKAAPRLQCCFLNGCLTGQLGFSICTQLPQLQVVCWSSVAEDAAARSFALGFYDAVGAMILANTGDISVELAYWAGLEHLSGDGFRLGDPSVYHHPPGHLHTFQPDLTSNPRCLGCLPPVHGMVQLLRSKDGKVESLRLEPPSSGIGGDEQFTWEPVDQDLKPLNPSPETSKRSGWSRSPSFRAPVSAPATASPVTSARAPAATEMVCPPVDAVSAA